MFFKDFKIKKYTHPLKRWMHIQFFSGCTSPLEVDAHPVF